MILSLKILPERYIILDNENYSLGGITMKKNAGNIDRTVRVVLGIIILALWFFLPGHAKYFALIGLIPLLTALIGWCPLYSIFGINTCKR